MRQLIRKWLGIKEEEEPIGEAYMGWFSGLCSAQYCSHDTLYGPGQFVYKNFFKFKKRDCTEYREKEVKIHGEWIKRDLVIFYKDPYEEQRNEILKKIEAESK